MTKKKLPVDIYNILADFIIHLTVVRFMPLFSCLRMMCGEGYMGIGGNAEMVTLRSLPPDRLL